MEQKQPKKGRKKAALAGVAALAVLGAAGVMVVGSSGADWSSTATAHGKMQTKPVIEVSIDGGATWASDVSLGKIFASLNPSETDISTAHVMIRSKAAVDATQLFALKTTVDVPDDYASVIAPGALKYGIEYISGGTGNETVSDPTADLPTADGPAMNFVEYLSGTSGEWYVYDDVTISLRLTEDTPETAAGYDFGAITFAWSAVAA